MAAHEIVVCVSSDPWELDAGFERDSLESLALDLRNALWSHFQIFYEGEVLVAHIVKDRVEAEEDPIEVMVRDTTNYL